MREYVYCYVRFVSRVLLVYGVSGLDLDNHSRKHVETPDGHEQLWLPCAAMQDCENKAKRDLFRCA